MILFIVFDLSSCTRDEADDDRASETRGDKGGTAGGGAYRNERGVT